MEPDIRARQRVIDFTCADTRLHDVQYNPTAASNEAMGSEVREWTLYVYAAAEHALNKGGGRLLHAALREGPVDD